MPVFHTKIIESILEPVAQQTSEMLMSGPLGEMPRPLDPPSPGLKGRYGVLDPY
ncbi:hypothetical protein KGM_203736 [Danaus plexippus plexippus]|uniref:Uncharacterized protein n=1 Tax=Danaus plexippus plexippus TaxID=278856 RepID=A0A212FNM1_DANPL|nr:hypothetical protein KGM_203736 [Danaus plexippus plexippus]